MRWMLRRTWLVLALLVLVISPPRAQQPEKRIAFVLGDAAYQAGALPTPANDAGLIGQTLQAVGFEVVGARDLDQAAFVNAWNDFLAKAQAAGPDAVAFVYLAGYGLQFNGENYFASVDSQIAASSDIATNAVRVSDISASLASVPLKARIFVLDAARANPFALNDPSIAGGLALVDPDDGTLVAFNAAPGTIAPEQGGAYGAYAQALAEMVGQGGLPLDEVFTRTRLRVSDATKGAFMPWNVSKVSVAFMFRDGTPDAVSSQSRAMMAKTIAELGPPDAYAATERLDTMEGYRDFLAAYPNDPMAPRVRAMLAVRREAIVWRRTYRADTPNAYWSYLMRYPRGPHAYDARRRLAYLTAPLEPPPAFEVFAYDEPPPPPEEFIYVERRVFYFDEPAFGFVAPPVIPVYFVPVINPYFVRLPPPPPAAGPMILPVPVVVPVIVNNQPYRPVQPVALAVVTPAIGTPPSARFKPLSNPATANLSATKPAGPPGPKLLVNPTIKPNNLTATKPADPSKPQPLKPLQANVNAQPAVTNPPKKLDAAKPGPAANLTVAPKKLDAVKPAPAAALSNPPKKLDVEKKPAMISRPPDTRANVNAAPKVTSTISSNPPAARVVAPVHPTPPPAAKPPPPRQAAAPARAASPPPCGKPGQPACPKH